MISIVGRYSYGDRLTYGEFGSRLRFGMGGRSWTVSTGNQTSTGFSTSHDLRPAVQGALTAQGVKGVLAAGNTTQALRNWAEMTISTEPAREQIYTFPGATPQGIQPPEGFGGNPNQPIWQEWFDNNSGLGVGSGYFPGSSGDHSLFQPYFSSGTGGLSDDEWEQFAEDLGALDDYINPGSWGKGGHQTLDESLNQHYGDHGIKVGAKSLQDYIDKSEEFKRLVLLDPNIIPTPVSGPTPNVFEYPSGDRYIWLEHRASGEKKIISFGEIWHR